MTQLQTKPEEKALAMPRPKLMEIGDRGLVMRHVDDLASFAKTVIESGLAPESFKTPQQIFVAVQMGMELGLSPMASLRTIAVVNGRACIWGDGKLALVRRSGLCARMEETIAGDGDNRTATCRVWRKGQEHPTVGTFSMAQAAKAGLLSKDNWKKYPDRMLTHRARYALNDAFPDVLFGLLTVEEAQDLAPVFDPDKAAGSGDKAEALVQKLGGPPASEPEQVAEGNVPPPAEPEPQLSEAPVSVLDELAAHVSGVTGLEPEECIEPILAWCDENKWSRSKLKGLRSIVVPKAKKVDWRARLAPQTEQVSS